MTQRLVEMKFIKDWRGNKKGEVIAVTRATAGLMEAQGVAIRVRPAHAKTKPITSADSVTKG